MCEVVMFNIHNMAFLVIVTVLLVQTACTPALQTTPMSIDGTRYDPAVERFPASVGVYFPDDFFDNNFYHETNDGHHHTFHNNPADATRRALALAFETSFAEVRYLETLQEGLDAEGLTFLETLQEGLDAEGLTFVVVPNIVSMVADLAPEVIAVMMTYQFEFFADGEHIHSWRVSGIDSVSRLSMKDVRPWAISPEQFDAVARRAVWDAISVLLVELDQQKLLTDRLPATVMNGKAIGLSRLIAADQVTLAMVLKRSRVTECPYKLCRYMACVINCTHGFLVATIRGG
jgi:hypothetical protein